MTDHGPSSDEVRRAAEVLRGGGLVAFPTETVYGLGADARLVTAVRCIFAAKGRPSSHPLIVHVRGAAELPALASSVSDAGWRLVEAFWPGPLSIVVRRSATVLDAVTGGLDTVAVRAPNHPVAQELLAALGAPIAAPSANPFGRVSATRAEHVRSDLGDRVDLVLDGGPSVSGIESTIVDVSGERPRVLRVGALERERIAHVLGHAVEVVSGASAVRVPGTLPSHYAPRARVELVAPGHVAETAAALAQSGQRVAAIVRGEAVRNLRDVTWLTLPESADEAAPQLYDTLREVDRLDCEVVVVALPAVERGLDEAIADRLRRAAAGR